MTHPEPGMAPSTWPLARGPGSGHWKLVRAGLSTFFTLPFVTSCVMFPALSSLSPQRLIIINNENIYSVWIINVCNKIFRDSSEYHTIMISVSNPCQKAMLSHTLSSERQSKSSKHLKLLYEHPIHLHKDHNQRNMRDK